MDPATVIALCKENIQPLRHGRNATQLGTALRAQEDTEAQQLLLQEKQMYEDAIKNYEGDDPLENWYEYISWMEQSYPKSGHESHIGKLLQQCLATFEKDPKYAQDRRYVRLWINYISMQKNPLELYQLLYNNGIGTMVADMYRAWAFELEQMEDYKRADEVYLIGISTLAEPREELDYAHKNFQLAIARRMLGHNEDRSEILLSEQRQAFSSLRAIKSGRRVTSIRTGHRVREYLPGTVPQTGSLNHAARSSARIPIYHDDSTGGLAKGASILDHVPIEETVHKENTIKPGPWSNSAKKYPLITSSVKPAFTVHEDLSDDNLQMENVRLFPNHTPFFDGRKYPEHATTPVYVPETSVSGFTLKPHYPKDLVYSNNIDRSMEEIRAEKYLERYSKNRDNKNVMDQLPGPELEPSVDILSHHQACETELQENERREKRKFQQEESAHIDEQQRQMDQQRLEAEQYELQRQRLQAEQQQVLQRQRFEEENLKLEKERREAEQRELERRRNSQLELERQRREAVLERQRYEAKQLKALEAVQIEAERIEAERIEAQRMEAELRNSQRKHQSSSFLMHRHHATSGAPESEEHLLGQSLTVNTKEAMSVVQDMWHSPSETTANLIPNPIRSSPIIQRISEARSKLSFDIHMDSSMTQQHAMSTTKEHPNSTYLVKSYHDQENHHYHNSYTNPESQAYGMPDPYQYQVAQHHDHRIHQHHHQQQQQQQQHQGHLQSPHQQAPMHHPVHSQAQQHHHSPHGQQSHNSPHPQQVHHSSHPQQHVIHHHHSPHSQQAHHSRHPQQIHHSSHSQAHQHPNSHLHHQQHQQQQQQQQQHQQQMYAAASATTMAYHQPYSMALHATPHQNVDPEKHLHYSSYDPTSESNKPYRMPEQLPYIKSPGMNRRDLKYLENADNKENSSGGAAVEYNNAVEAHMPKVENNLYVDESLGTAPLSSGNDTCFTEAFSAPLPSSTPLTNQFRQIYRSKDCAPSPHYPVQNVELMPQQGSSDITASENDGKLSVIMESTREYVSSSSGSSVNTRTVGFTTARDEPLPIEEQAAKLEADGSQSPLGINKTYEEQMRAKIQAVHAQSPRTVQRNVDQITSEIKNNCDLRIPFKLNSEPCNDDAKVDSMDCDNQEPMEQVEEEEFVLPTGDINPFDKGLIAGLLKKIKFPQKHHSEGYVRLNINLNKIVPSTAITLGTDRYEVEKCLGKGTYGTVVKAVNSQTRQVVALKTQKPAWVWEYYIAREIKTRLCNPHMLRGFMDIEKAYVADNGSVLVSQFSKYGTLLAVTNQVKIATGKPLVESLAIFFTIEMLQIVEYLHKCQIIHGDIKPDNFLLMHLPTEDVRPTIQLIDFGCSIDMQLLPEDTKFRQIIKTQDFTCIEMQTGRPWTYQTDLYCLAGSSHCLLFGNYMRVSVNGGRWSINSKLPRYAKRAAWEKYFTELLNIESCDQMPDLTKLRNMMEESLGQFSEVQGKLRTFANVLNKR